jgi:glycyl-tRNA synthetase beta chain
MAEFLLEVGTEELPADFVSSAIAQWQEKIPRSLATEQLSPSSMEIYGTPRRLAVFMQGLPEQQSDRSEEIKGPPSSSAFKDGQPTPALEGFLRKQELVLADVERRSTEKGEFIFVQKKIPGRRSTEILQELIPTWLGSLEGRRFMRWGDGDFRFPRPLRWLVALWDREILPVEIVNGSSSLRSDRLSRGHRILHPEPVSIPNPAAYQEALGKAYVEVDPEQRTQQIREQIEAVAKSLQGEAEIPEDLLAEVTNLVEYPTACAGKFDAEFLELPAEVITTVMVTHQRYFPVRGQEGLLPYFITVANGDPAKAELIARGNERVIRARLADAQFFYQADCDDSLASYLPLLENVTFQEELGTMRDKVDRIMEIAQMIAEQLDLDEAHRTEVESTALLCKADLVTQMVYEFPELQGIMGQKYALVSGEPSAVALGIFEHYLPRNAEDRLPSSIAGQVVGLSDRLDTLVSIFGLGMLPTGSSDPFALRRAANAIIHIIWSAALPLDLGQLL